MKKFTDYLNEESKDYYSILKTFLTKTYPAKLPELEKVKDDKTKVIKMYNKYSSMLNERLYDAEDEEGPWASRDGWDKRFFDDVGLNDLLADAAKLDYEIKNARRGSYALDDGSIAEMIHYLTDLKERFDYTIEEIHNYIK